MLSRTHVGPSGAKSTNPAWAAQHHLHPRGAQNVYLSMSSERSANSLTGSRTPVSRALSSRLKGGLVGQAEIMTVRPSKMFGEN